MNYIGILMLTVVILFSIVFMIKVILSLFGK